MTYESRAIIFRNQVSEKNFYGLSRRLVPIVTHVTGGTVQDKCLLLNSHSFSKDYEITENGNLPVTYKIFLYIISQSCSCFDNTNSTLFAYSIYISVVLDTDISDFTHPLRSVKLDH